ncbi:hypothetical protein [Sulfobacillus thermosulfidooxidans]|uniref:hypothetical protein n=1 Tax=Sulfobacillus thermosulfidooxidans TaxID=28034 RepID=UPI00096BAC1F|nr:hypothetical protein [Sulfobacillus thermosulfidooxidans]OLZ09930.1 hypothetical protein BFX05_13515 [Sulfobacillus thermosulfidooxidans]OLZ15765.1 hypothetical protein BFX06_01525 [Sulfobacillus thermosulfidooxidans]OLZ18388.1 hypothetical protein BFX07_08600 [Sulfobacillus thermosulfidooxidans]
MTAMISALFLGIVVMVWHSRTLRLTSLLWVTGGLFVPWLWHPTLTGALLLTVISLLGFLGEWKAPLSRKMIRQKRWSLVRFWRTTAFFLTAGMTFWQAVDQAVLAVPEVALDIGYLAKLIGAQRADASALLTFRTQYPGPEGDLVATMMAYGYQNGLQAEDAISQAWDMEEQLALEEALKKQSDPLWLTLLPALLLLNVLMMFVGPMIVMAIKNWSVLAH